MNLDQLIFFKWENSQLKLLSLVHCLHYIYFSLSYPTYECLSTLLGMSWLLTFNIHLYHLNYYMWNNSVSFSAVPCLGVYSLRPEVFSLVPWFQSLSAPVHLQHSHQTDFTKTYLVMLFFCLRTITVLVPYPEAFKVDSKPSFRILPIPPFSMRPLLLPPWTGSRTYHHFHASLLRLPCPLFFNWRNVHSSNYYTSVKPPPIFPHRLFICLYVLRSEFTLHLPHCVIIIYVLFSH